MADISNQILPSLHQFNIIDPQIEGDFIFPYYEGRSVVNIPSSICGFFNIPPFSSSPLDSIYLSPLDIEDGSNIQRVILIVMDALSLHRLQRWMRSEESQIWSTLTQEGQLAPITSMCPSTTSSCLTSLWTGQGPATHGVMGYEMWLKEYGVVANTILHTPMSYNNAVGSLTNAGFSPENFLQLPTLGSHLAKNDVQSYALLNNNIIHSGLSQMFFRDVKSHGFRTSTDLWINLRNLIESRLSERLFAWVYWGEVDGFSHLYGPDDEHPKAEFASFSKSFESLFFNRLSAQARKDTIIILTSDHGQITTPKDPHLNLSNHPQFTRNLHILPTGENRLIYLYIRPGKVEAVREYIHKTWPNKFTVMHPVDAVEQGLFGLNSIHPKLYDRIGDLLLIARDDAYLWWAEKKNPLLGRHGGLHAEEMLIPLLAVRM